MGRNLKWHLPLASHLEEEVMMSVMFNKAWMRTWEAEVILGEGVWWYGGGSGGGQRHKKCLGSTN